MPLSALLLWGLSEPAQLSALAPPAPFFLYSCALSQGLWRCSRRCVCLAAPACQLVASHPSPSCSCLVAGGSGWGGSPQSVGNPSAGLHVNPSAASPVGVSSAGSREVAQCRVVGEVLGGGCPIAFAFPSPSAWLLAQGWALC